MANIKTEKTCFVIMPFSDDMAEVYWKAIQPACDKAGFSALRVDQLEGVYNINQKIIEHIFSSHVIIADLTDWRPNVFYEMGVAHAIDNKTIMIIQKKDKVPFDVHSYRCIEYEQTEAGLTKLLNSLINSLKSFDAWRQHPTNPVQQFKPFDAFVPNSNWEKLQREHQKLQQELTAQEQRLRQAAAPSELKALQQQLAQKTAEVAKLQLELARLQPVPKPKSSPKLALRSQPIDKLSEEQVKKMLREKDFFDGNKNKNGKGVAHKYEPLEREDQKLVLDQTTGLLWQQSGGGKPLTYKHAQEYVQKLNQQRFAGYNDWYLPTLEEAMSLMEPKKHGELYLDRVFDHKQYWIWTSDHQSERAAWVVYFFTGNCTGHRVDDGDGYVRVVRGG